jgi:hypothetical protein
MPAAKAASASDTSRPRDRDHPGRLNSRIGIDEGANGNESMPETLHRMCGLCHPFQQYPHCLSLSFYE